VGLLLASGVPAGPIRDYKQVLEQDPHVKARGMVATFEHPIEGETKVLASPLHLQGTPTRIWAPPPLLGQHTDEVLAEVRERITAEREARNGA
jgi:crotonobetainyl-CoA:carnitine CoA-transferase CaiB-like acyl-CoA transferase